LPHPLQLFDDGVHAARTDQQRAIGKPARDFLGELLARQQFLGQHGILGKHNCDAPMQLHRNSRSRWGEILGHN
jgi:hypothetical protein